MLNNFTIKARLLGLIGLLSLVAAAAGILGIHNLNETNAALKTVYEDRLVAVGDLSNILSQMQQNQNALALGVHSAPSDVPAEMAAVDARIAVVSKMWGVYMSTYLTAEEKARAEVFIAHRKTFVEQGVRPMMALLQAGDTAAAVTQLKGPLMQRFQPVRDAMRALIQLQLDVGKREYEEAVARAEHARLLATLLIIGGGLAGIVVGLSLVRGITTAIALALQVANNVAAGDLRGEIVVRSKDEVGQLLSALKKMNHGLVDIVSQVRSGTDLIASTSGQISSGTQDLSSRTEQQASSLEETAASMEQLTSTVRQNADNSRQANQFAAAASEVATRGGVAIADVVGTMERISAASRKIVDIISVIDGIAFQTNILALNAAVEAARAGEQGRGFAVVAGEVRNLAQRASQAAKEIKGLIDSSVSEVKAGSEQVAAAGATMQDIVRSIQQVSTIIGEIASASDEQSAGIGQVNQAVIMMDQVTQQNAALVEEAAGAADLMQQQAAKLADVVGIFQLTAAAPTGLAPQRPQASRPLALAQSLSD